MNPTTLAHGNIADALAAVAESQPGAPLLHLLGQPALIYADLAWQIHHVTERLVRWGIACGDVVAGCVESRPHMALACAALPASSTFAPLAPTLSAEAYESLLERLQPKAVLVPVARDHPLRGAAHRLGIPELRLIPDPATAFRRFVLDLSGTATPGPPLRRPRPEFAYVLATSGTTGRPKLVPLAHRQMLRFATTMIDWLRFVPDDVGCAVSPFHLAGGLRATLLIPWLSGGSVICLPEGDSEALYRALDEFAPTYVSAGFAIHRALLRRASEHRAPDASTPLRFLRPTTGRLEPDEIDRLEQAFRTPVVVGYGSTEACGIAHDLLPPQPRKRGAVGLPMAGEIAIIDDAGEICPQGAIGEIVVRGPLVFDGYFDDPELTARSFVGRWFRTGDLGRIDEDGYVFVHGRLNEIINRGGEKIAPSEIDSALESLPGVEEAATFGVPHATLGEELVAAVVRGANAPIDEASLMDELRRRMGSRRLPRRIYFVERLPRTESGKLQRAGLPELVGFAPGQSLTGNRIAPARALSPLEAALAELWSDVLRSHSAGPDDDFFLLGGDSLSGTQLLAQVNEAFGVALPLRVLFEDAATIAGMARAIEREREGEPCARYGS